MIDAKKAALDSANHWAKLAQDERNRAAYEKNRDPQGDVTVYYNRAHRYEQTAQALRLEAETGLPHCGCHLIPSFQCLSKPK